MHFRLMANDGERVRLLILCVCVAFCTQGCTDSATNPAPESKRAVNVAQVDQVVANPGNELTGTWGFVSAESDGQPLLLPRASLRQEFSNGKVRFGRVNDMSECAFTIDADANPRHYDVSAGDRIQLGIYRVDDDMLLICSATSTQLRPDDFKTAAGDGRTLMVFRRMNLDGLDQPVTRTEAESFTQQLHAAAKSGDAASYNALVDLEGILERITQGLGLSDSQRLTFIDGLKTHSQMLSDGPASLGGRITQTVAGGGLHRVLQTRYEANAWRVLCRLVSAEGGLSYQEFVLGRDVFGNTRATDMHLFAMGESLAATQRRTLLPALAGLSAAVLETLSPSDRIYVESEKEVRRYVIALQSEQFAAAEKKYYGLPETVRAEKWLLLARLNKSSGQDRHGVLRECLRLHPSEPAFDLLAMEDAINRADKDAAFEIIERLETRVGSDPYLDFLRGKTCERAGDLDGARRFTEKAKNAEPELGRFIIGSATEG
jgi:uncharacterized protein (TIGR03067 family)